MTGMSIIDIELAEQCLGGIAIRTPVLSSPALDDVVGASVFLKLETHQVTGSFKFRGIYNRMARLSKAERGRGVVTASSGNAALALARSAQLLGAPCTVFIPAEAEGDPSAKRLAAEALGAEVRFYDRSSGNRDALRDAFASESGATVVPSSGHHDVIAGQGTVASELLAEAGPLDALVVPVAGGGLLAGTAIVGAARAPTMRVIGVEPEASNDMKVSLESGSVVSVTVRDGDSIADALLLDRPSELAFETCRTVLPSDAIVLVDDAAILDAVRLLHELAGVIAEPAGAVALAAVLCGSAGVKPRERIGVVVSGGNVEPDVFARFVPS